MPPPLYITIAITGLLLSGCAAPLSAPEQPQVPASGKPADHIAPSTGLPVQNGMMGYIDPETGQITDTPRTPKQAPIELSPELENAMSTSSEGLEEKKSLLPGGGYYIDLEGRFQSPLIGTHGKDGKINFVHPVRENSHSRLGSNDEKQ